MEAKPVQRSVRSRCARVRRSNATALLIVTPGGLDEYFEELSAALAAHADTAKVRTIQQAYGIARS